MLCFADSWKSIKCWKKVWHDKNHEEKFQEQINSTYMISAKSAERRKHFRSDMMCPTKHKNNTKYHDMDKIARCLVVYDFASYDVRTCNMR